MNFQSFNLITNFLLLSVFIHETIRYNYPVQYNNIITSIAYNSIYFFSKIQLIMIKIDFYLEKTNPRLKNFLKNLYKNKNNIEFILDGNVIYETTKTQINQIENKLPEVFDFIIYSDYSNNINNKCLLNVVPNNFNNFNYENTNFKFILFEIEIDDKKIKIDFKTDNYNYLISGNIINSKMIHYFLNTYHKNDKINFDKIDEFKVNLIDQYVNSLKFDNKLQIQLTKNNYENINK